MPRKRALLLGVGGAALLALVAVLFGRVNSDSAPDIAVAKLNLAPFREALDSLAESPGLRYRDTAIAGITERDITVTATGSQFGTTGSGNRQHDRDVLRIGGKTFTRWHVDPALEQDAAPGMKPPSEWSVGYDDSSTTLSEVLVQRPSPPELAGQLYKALTELGDVPQPDSSDSQRPLTVNGTSALGIDTSAGRLLVTRQQPHRVLRLEPYDLSEVAERFKNGQMPTEIPRVSTGPLANGDSEGLDLIPIGGAAATVMFDALEKQAHQLENASDQGIIFTLDGSGQMNCGPEGCTATQRFTGEVSSQARGRITKGSVSAVMSATFSIGGEPAGRCTSARGTFPLNGTGVAGSLTCSDPGAGGVYTAVAARHKAQAEAQSRASGGRPVHYTIPLRAQTLIDARALAAVEVKALVNQVRRERDTAPCTMAGAVPSGLVLPSGARPPHAVQAIHLTHRVATLGAKSCKTRVSPVASDWATKGAHLHIPQKKGAEHEVRIYVDGKGNIVGEPIRLSTGMASDRSVQAAVDAVNNSAALRADLLAKSKSAKDHMDSHNWGNSQNRSAEMQRMIDKLENWP